MPTRPCLLVAQLSAGEFGEENALACAGDVAHACRVRCPAPMMCIRRLS